MLVYIVQPSDVDKASDAQQLSLSDNAADVYALKVCDVSMP